MKSFLRSLLQTVPLSFSITLALFQLIPGEQLSLKKTIVLIAVFLLASAAGLILKKIIHGRLKISGRARVTSLFASLAISVFCTAIFHLSLPQKEIILNSRSISIRVTDADTSPDATGIRFLSLNNGYRGIAFAGFTLEGQWERQADQLILSEYTDQAGITFEGKTGQTVELFFIADRETGTVTVDWGDAIQETIDLSRETDEPFSLMISHDYGASAAWLDKLNFFFNLLSVFIPLTYLTLGYLVFLQTLLNRRSRQFKQIFVLLSFCTVIIRVVNVYNFPLGWDEGTYARAAMRYSEKVLTFDWQEIPAIMYNHEHPALVKLLFAIPATLDGRDAYAKFGWDQLNNVALGKEDYTIFTGRLVSAVFSLWLVQSGAYLIHPLTGFLLMIHSLAAEYGAQARLEAIPMLFSFLSIWFFNQFLSCWDTPKKRKAARWLILSALCLGLTAASKIIYCVIAFAMLFMAIESLIRNRALWRRWILAMISMALIAVASFYIFNPSIWYQPAERLKLMLTFHDRYQQNAGDIYPAWQPVAWITRSVAHQSGRFFEKSPLAKAPHHFFFSSDELIFLFACLGAVRLFQNKRIYAYWFIIGMIFLFLWGTKWEQYACVVVMPICVAATFGILRFAQKLTENNESLSPSNNH